MINLLLSLTLARFYTLPKPEAGSTCEDRRNNAAIMNATIRSGHAECVDQTARLAAITATLPMASFLEQSHTDRTFASPSLYRAKSATLKTFAANASNPNRTHDLSFWYPKDEELINGRSNDPKPH